MSFAAVYNGTRRLWSVKLFFLLIQGYLSSGRGSETTATQAYRQTGTNRRIVHRILASGKTGGYLSAAWASGERGAAIDEPLEGAKNGEIGDIEELIE